MKLCGTPPAYTTHVKCWLPKLTKFLSVLVNSVEVVNGIGVGPGCLYPGATTAELSSPSPPVVNGTGSGFSVEESVQHLSPHHSLSLGHSLNGGCGDSAPLITSLGMGVGVGAGIVGRNSRNTVRRWILTTKLTNFLTYIELNYFSSQFKK